MQTTTLNFDIFKCWNVDNYFKKGLDSNVIYTQWSPDRNLPSYSLGNFFIWELFYLRFVLLDNVIVPKLH